MPRESSVFLRRAELKSTGNIQTLRRLEINMVFSTVLDATEHVKNKAAKKLESVKEGKPIE